MDEWTPQNAVTAPASAVLAGAPLRIGDTVRLRPRVGADIFDLALAARLAQVVAIERDLEGDIHVAVTVNDDPGRDLGHDGRPAHRFYFRLAELERANAAGPEPGGGESP
jgi:hypothetical protein